MDGDEIEHHTCSLSHVEEAQELQDIVKSIISNSTEVSPFHVSRFSQIISKYTEQSQLLDPLLEQLVSPLALVLVDISSSPTSHAAENIAKAAPIGRLLWQLGIVRGPKIILRFFPNDAACLEPAISMLQSIDDHYNINNNENINESRPWELQWVLLLWLCMLVLIPFDLSLVDSNMTTTTGYPSIVKQLLDLCKRHLALPGSTREMAAGVIGRLLSRHDMVQALTEFQQWGSTILSHFDTATTITTSTTNNNNNCSNTSDIEQTNSYEYNPSNAVFIVPGIMLAFATLFDLGKRDLLLPAAVNIFPRAADLILQANSIKSNSMASRNALSRKLAVKVVQRIGLVFLRPRVAAWRYIKGQKILNVAAGSRSDGRKGSSNEQEGEGDGDEEGALEDLAQHAQHIEGVIEALLTGLADKDTIVRWSAAKGLGRVTGRLPKDFADDVIASILEEFFTPATSDTSWHGGCLAIAELARRGLLLPGRLSPEVVPILERSLEYDVRRGHSSVGAHVRDAAAYVCWALARAYTPDTLQDAALKLAPALITLALYDKEVNCRRAAAAAFQECAGRLGNFPHGIEILTCADYFTVSVRAQAYLVVGPQVAAFGGEGYLEVMAWHLARNKSRHWEKGVRELAARGLASLVNLHPGFISQEIIPYLLPLCMDGSIEVRHGAVAAIAELLPAIQAAGDPSNILRLNVCSNSDEVSNQIGSIIPRLHQEKLTKGKGGEILKSALCRLVETTCLVGVELTPSQRQCIYRETILDCLRHSSPDIQQAAAAALSTFSNRYCSQPTEENLDKTQRLFTVELLNATNVSAATQRGAALALGSIPVSLLSKVKQPVVSVLAMVAVSGAKRTAPHTTDSSGLVVDDVETRVNAIHSLCKVTSALVHRSTDAHTDNDDDVDNGKEILLCVRVAIDVLTEALHDYSSDNRGDVGSWVREAAMTGLPQLLAMMIKMKKEMQQDTDTEDEEDDEKLWCGCLIGLLKQAVERLGRLRSRAMSCIQDIMHLDVDDSGNRNHSCMYPLYNAVSLALQPYYQTRQPAGVDNNNNNSNNNAGIVDIESLSALPSVARLLCYSELQEPLLEGLACSIGGLDASLAKAASDALVEGIGSLVGRDHDGDDDDDGNLLLSTVATSYINVWKKWSKSTRMATPLLITADVLVSKTALNTLTPPHHSFLTDILSCAAVECSKCSDIARLKAGASLFSQLVAGLDTPVVHAEATRCLLMLLGNRFPKIRRYAAEQLYTALLIVGDAESEVQMGEEEFMCVQEVLSDVAWDGGMVEVREARSRLFGLFKIVEPVRKSVEVEGGGEVKKVGGEGESYQGLIDRVARDM